MEEGGGVVVGLDEGEHVVLDAVGVGFGLVAAVLDEGVVAGDVDVDDIGDGGQLAAVGLELGEEGGGLGVGVVLGVEAADEDGGVGDEVVDVGDELFHAAELFAGDFQLDGGGDGDFLDDVFLGDFRADFAEMAGEALRGGELEQRDGFAGGGGTIQIDYSRSHVILMNDEIRMTKFE